jgi:hypothetical protein
MADMMMDNGKKYIVDDDSKYATKGVAGTALGLGIGALGVELLNGGLQKILNGGNSQPQSQEETSFGLYKGYRDADDAIIAKHNADSFALFKGYTDAISALKAEVDALKTKIAVGEATQPWKEKSLYDAIAIEAERRECADNKIVNYANSTFVPKYIADMTVGTGTTQASTFNPLCGC